MLTRETKQSRNTDASRANPQSKAVPAASQGSPSFARAMGNRAMGTRIQRKCGCGGSCGSCARESSEVQRIQAKLTVGPAHDPYEQEADRIADHVMRMPVDSTGMSGGGSVALGIQRVASSDTGGFDPGPGFNASQQGGHPLSAATRNYMEPRFGVDFSGVRVHSGSGAAESASRIQARAYTYGNHITLGEGASENDHRLMAHELTHVVQQGGGKDTTQRTPLESRVQRDPRQQSCPDGVKTVDVYPVNLPGATRDISADVAKTNAVLAQCCVAINVVGGESWNTNLLDLQTPNNSLNEFTTMASPTTEETTMLAHMPGGDVIHVYYVPAMSAGSRGENFRPSVNPAVPKAVVVSDSAAVDTLVHELGHILFDVSAHDTDPDKLMASGDIRNVGVDKITSTQCASI